MANLINAVCKQDYSVANPKAFWLRMNYNDHGQMCIDALEHEVNCNLVANTLDELNEAILEKLITTGEQVTVEYQKDANFDMTILGKINYQANEIAKKTRRGCGNVIIANSKMLELLMPLLSKGPFVSQFHIEEYENVPNNVCIVLYRGGVPGGTVFKANAGDGSPILLLNQEDGSWKEYNYGWTGEDLTTDYVKVIHFKET